MSSKASLLASLTGDDTPLSTTTQGGGDGAVGEEGGLRSVPIDSTENDGITNQTKDGSGGGDVVAEGAGLFSVGDDEEEEADLFGSIPSSSSSANKASPADTRSTNTGRNLLAGSGLMGDLADDAAAAVSSTSGGGGDGLFDEVDAEAERERLRLEEEEKERQRKLIQEQKEREERERAEAARREKERLEALERERAAAALKQQQEQEAAAAAEAAARAQMQDMSLNGRQQVPPTDNPDVFYRPDAAATVPHFHNPLAHHQQQPPPPQQQQQPINAGYGASSYYYSTSGQQTTTAPHLQQQQQQQPQQQHQPAYQPPQPPPQQPPPPAPTPAPLMHGRYHHQQMSTTTPSMPTAPPPPPPGAASVAPSTISSVTAPSLLAGMHVGHNPNVGGVVPPPSAPPRPNASASPASTAPPPPPVPAFQPFYGLVTVADPILVQGSGLFAGPPHWTYGITVRMNQNSNGGGPNSGAIQVRRRFKHFVALEDRLRIACPGAILPPRPDKHAARAIEEASTRQSAQFALQRAAELETYLNGLINHPIVGSSDVLRLFLTLQDHIGVAWPEVSSSAITRLSTLSDKAATKIADGTSNVMQDLGVAQQQAAGEDNAEILALVASEGVRIGAVSQAVPKMEGTVALLRDHADRCGVVGLELSKLSKDVQTAHAELAVPLDLLSSALLRTGRRSKRLAVELSAAMTPFTLQYKLCRYERMAFADRRQALAKRTQARQKADARATKLHLHQSSLQTRHNIPALERMEMEAAMTDEHAGEAVREADKIGATLLEEIKRVTSTRNEEWRGSVKVLASSMKEACAERVSIWESVREQFEVEFPDMVVAPPAGGGNSGGNDGHPAPSAPPQSESGKSNEVPTNVVDNGQASSAVSYSTTGATSAVQG